MKNLGIGDKKMKKYLISLVKKAVELLVDGKFEELTIKTNSEIEPGQIEASLLEYHGSITLPPDEAYEDVYILKISSRDAYSVEFDLWYDNEVSDLRIYLDVEPPYRGEYNFRIVNIRVP